jgi:hypothetical protein
MTLFPFSAFWQFQWLIKRKWLLQIRQWLNELCMVFLDET